MYAKIQYLGKQMLQTDPSKMDERLFSDILRLKQGRKIQDCFYFLRQGVPEGRSSEGYANFKQVKPWPCHAEVIPGVSVVALVTNEELCKVV